MSKLDAFEKRLVETQPPVSFDFAIFAPFLINALIDLLSGCGMDGTARAKAALQQPTSRRTRYLVRRAVKAASDESGIAVVGSDIRTTSDAFLATCNQCDESELIALFGETEEITRDVVVFL